MSAVSLPSLFVSHWELSLALEAQAAVIAGIYLYGVRRVRGRWPLRRSLAFLGGIGCVLVALESGIDAYDDRMLSAHMVQHMLLLLIAPLLLLEGRPLILALRVLPARQRRRLAAALPTIRPLTRPLPCLAVFYAVLLLTHVPGFYDATLRHPALHELEHALYLASGLLMWWPLLDGDPVPGYRLGGLARLGYVIATMPPMALIGSYLSRAPSLVYSGYAAPAQTLHLSALTDQAQAGALMWVGGNIVMVATGLCVTVAALRAEERRMAARERSSLGAGEPEVAAPGGGAR